MRDNIARKTITLEEKIAKAEGEVAAAKKKYDAPVDRLEKLIEKQKKLEDKKVLNACRARNRITDEIVRLCQLAIR